MTLSFVGVKNHGNLERERIVLRADAATKVGRYAIFKAKTNDGFGVTSEVIDSLWFPDFDAMAGDLVIIYTKEGEFSKKENSSGTTSHFVYWESKHTLWETSKYLPVLIQIATWSVLRDKEADDEI